MGYRPDSIKYDCTNLENGRSSLDQCESLYSWGDSSRFLYPLKVESSNNGGHTMIEKPCDKDSLIIVTGEGGTYQVVCSDVKIPKCDALDNDYEVSFTCPTS